jgi:hypothetical protein
MSESSVLESTFLVWQDLPKFDVPKRKTVTVGVDIETRTIKY